jgi:hypothetical protein
MGALDVQIIGPNGPIAREGSDSTGMYAMLARHAYGELVANHPEVADNIRWGGKFATKSGVPDLEHLDLGGGSNGAAYGPSLQARGWIGTNGATASKSTSTAPRADAGPSTAPGSVQLAGDIPTGGAVKAPPAGNAGTANTPVPSTGPYGAPAVATGAGVGAKAFPQPSDAQLLDYYGSPRTVVGPQSRADYRQDYAQDFSPGGGLVDKGPGSPSSLNVMPAGISTPSPGTPTPGRPYAAVRRRSSSPTQAFRDRWPGAARFWGSPSTAPPAWG